MDLIQSEKEHTKKPQQEVTNTTEQVDMPHHDLILKKTEGILSQLKNKKDQHEEEWIVYLLSIPFILISIAAIVKWGFLWRVVPVIAFCIYLGYFRWKMILVTKEAVKVKLPAQQEFQYKGAWLKSKINYLLSGIKVKLTRFKYLSWMYFLFCPWLLYFVYELIKEPVQGMLFGITMIAAYIIGGIFWLFHFRQDIEEIEKMQLEFESYLNQL